MQLDQKQIFAFQQKILAWYVDNKRDLPWRKTRDPYAILVSEVMSQQTQIPRVIGKYQAWMKRFPTVASLAQSSAADVLRYWSGLGYNRRALNVKKTAEIVAQKYKGVFPKNEQELLALPGIGMYTARAILCFAFDQQVAVVDTNVRKVILTQFSRGNDIINEKGLQQIAEQLLPNGKAYEWNQALMDYASSVLKKEKIPIPKQSKFVGSHRYYRGQVLKILLQKKKILLPEIGKLIKKEYQQAEEEWLRELLYELQEEGFIVIIDNMVMLVN